MHNYSSTIKVWEKHVAASCECLLTRIRQSQITFCKHDSINSVKKKKAQKPKIKLERCDSTLNLSATIYIYM